MTRTSIDSDGDVLARRMRHGASVYFRETSLNRKLSPVAVGERVGVARRHTAVRPYCCSTFAAIEATCPGSCPFKGNGCMADGGFTRVASSRLNAAARGATELQVIFEEAREIDRSFRGGRVPQDGARGGRDLRLHVGGDVQTVPAALTLAAAAARWRERGGGTVWTFTHGWRSLPRAAWGSISVLASVDHPADMAAALAADYAPAIVVPKLPSDGRRFTPVGGDVPAIPCPAETRGTTCVECRLCLDRPLALMGVGIAFGVHGVGAAAAREALVRVAKRRAT